MCTEKEKRRKQKESDNGTDEKRKEKGGKEESLAWTSKTKGKVTNAPEEYGKSPEDGHTLPRRSKDFERIGSLIARCDRTELCAS